jgi:hypothetical protein
MVTLAQTRSDIYAVTYRPQLLIIAAGVAVAGLNIFATGNPTSSQRLLASAIIILSFIPTLRFISKGESGLPFLPLFGGIYSILYALPVFLLDSFEFKGFVFDDGIVEKSLFLALLGLASLLVAIYWFPLTAKVPILPKVSLYWNIHKVNRMAPVFALIGLALAYLQTILPIEAVLQQVILFLSQFSLLAICMLFIVQLQGKLTLVQKLFLWGVLIPLQLILDLSTGAVYQVMKDIVPMIMIYWGLKLRIPWRVVLLGLFLLVLLRGNQAEFRTILRGPSYEGVSILDRSKLYATIVIDNTRNSGVVDAYTKTMGRLSQLITLADVVNQTPESVPYWNGESYYTLLTSLVPRILWPDKPTKTLGQTFGHRYGRLHPGDFETSENLPQLVEMYANFGPLGILIGMFITGLIYRSLYYMINHSNAGEGGLLIAAIIFTGLLSIESDFSLVFGAVIQYIVLIYLSLKPLKVSTSNSQSS